MIECQTRDEFVTDSKKGNCETRQPTAQIQDRTARGQHGVGHALIINARENSIAIPVAEPIRRRDS
jgi:hypothetical protein